MGIMFTGFFAFIYLIFSIIPPLLSEGSDPTLRVVLVVNCAVQIIQIILQIAFTVDLEKKACTELRLLNRGVCVWRTKASYPILMLGFASCFPWVSLLKCKLLLLIRPKDAAPYAVQWWVWKFEQIQISLFRRSALPTKKRKSLVTRCWCSYSS